MREATVEFVVGKHAVPMEEDGHDCPGTPAYIATLGLWFCKSCDWTRTITIEDCHLCGQKDLDPLFPMEGDAFISFKDETLERILSMHTSCCIQAYLQSRCSDDQEDTEGETH